ncbi:MAG TPA: hypothetical protein PLJ27_07525 [Polyangiaceae bacterium]|nr:hypothetical protein [Polyangiaceae bacterium]HQM09592.1 hypothetical protein [Polyangiaceae bacterium]
MPFSLIPSSPQWIADGLAKRLIDKKRRRWGGCVSQCSPRSGTDSGAVMA